VDAAGISLFSSKTIGIIYHIVPHVAVPTGFGRRDDVRTASPTYRLMQSIYHPLPARTEPAWSRRYVRPCLAAVGLIVLCSSAQAAGGPENVLLVVNPRSPDSLCIANHYAALRHIPPGNWLFVDWDPKLESSPGITDIDTFREKILTPVVRETRRMIPAREIDFVVYSSGFPWAIRFDDDMKKINEFLDKHEKEEEAKPGGKDQPTRPGLKASTWLKYMKPVASITGLTFLYEPVLAGSPLGGLMYVHPNSNWYARTGSPQQKNEPTLSFSSLTAYGPHGEALSAGGRHYLLSIVLGVTSGRGNTVDEVLACLRRSAAADATHPRGTIYYVQNGDVRSKVRQAGFPEAVKQLKALGVAAEILDGAVPRNKPDVQGAMLGVADFDWKASGSTILPGAICEHFTSFGGVMSGNGQTVLSEWLRYGAAAASGTVEEPYAIPQKFPSPAIQVYYARGCTAAESFYQSVLSPYQLLIVGDPLCRPWANAPEITVGGVTWGGPVKGEMKLTPKARFAGGVQVEHFELVVDGQRVRDCAADGKFVLDTDLLPDGSHEMRIVAASRGPLVARGEKIIVFSTANHGRKIEATCEPADKVSLKKSLIITAKSPHSSVIHVYCGPRLLGTISGDGGQIEVPAAQLGRGPVRIQLVGLGDEGPKSWVQAQPLDIEVVE
jgi:hypothetical protein